MSQSGRSDNRQSSKNNELSAECKDYSVFKMYTSTTALLVVDVQAKLINAIQDSEQILWNIKRLIEASRILDVYICFTEQNPMKLGPTVQSLAEGNQEMPIKKMTFSCLKSDELLKRLKKNGIKSILLCGVESHVCIQQTSIDLMSEGFSVFIAIDAIGSRREIDHNTAIRRLDSSGVILSTTESAIFEWCNTAERKEFKEISRLIKETIERI